jgi:hypothetical protein
MTIFSWTTSSGSWNTATDWTPAGVPTLSDTAVFATGSTVHYTVISGTLSDAAASSIEVESDSLTLSGSYVSQALTVDEGGTLALSVPPGFTFTNATINAVLTSETVAGPVEVGGTGPSSGGTLDLTGASLLDDQTAVVDGVGAAPAVVDVAGDWVNSDGATIIGAGATVSIMGGTLTPGPAGLLITDGATLYYPYGLGATGTVDGAVILAGGTLAGDPGLVVFPSDGTVGPVSPIEVDGQDNVITGYFGSIGSVVDGTIAGGFTDDAYFLDLTAPSSFSDGLTIETGTLELSAAGAAGGGAIVFANNATATLRIEFGATPTNLIQGFSAGDTIDLPFVPYAPDLSVSNVAGTVSLSAQGTIEAVLTLAGTSAALPLLVVSDTSGGTELIPLTVAAVGSTGTWAAPTEWSSGAVPGSTDGVEITAPGSYTITVQGTQQAAGIGLDAAGASLVVPIGSTLITNGFVSDAGSLFVAGTMVAQAIAMANTTLTIAGYLEALLPALGNAGSTEFMPVVTANGGQINVIGSLNESIELNAAGAAPITLNDQVPGGSLSALLLQPGTIIASGNINLSGTTADVLVAGGTVSDAVSTSFVTFGGAVNAELIVPSQTGTHTTTVTAGAGLDTVVASGGAETIAGGTGQLTFIGGQIESLPLILPGANIGPPGSIVTPDTIAPYTALVFGGTGELSAYGANANAGLSAASIGTNIFIGGSAGGNVLVSGGGASTLFGGGSGDLLVADGNAAQSGSNQAILLAGPGNETLTGAGFTVGNLFYGGGGADLIVAGGNDTVVAGAGNQTIFGGNAGQTAILAGSGQDLIVAGADADYIAASSGSALVFAGSGDLFGFVNGQAGGVMDIVGFSVGSDLLQLQGYGSNTVANALANATIAGGSTILSLPDATKVVLYGVTNLTASSFI